MIIEGYYGGELHFIIEKSRRGKPWTLTRAKSGGREGFTSKESAMAFCENLCYSWVIEWRIDGKRDTSRMCNRCGKNPALISYATCRTCHDESLTEAEHYYNVE